MCVSLFTAIVSDHNYRDLKNNYYNDSMMFCLHMNGRLLLGLLSEGGEQGRADLRDSLLVNELQALVDGVCTNDAALARVEEDAAHAGVSTFGLGVLGKEAVGVDNQLERDIAVLEELHLLLHEGLVLLAGFLEDLVDQGQVALAAADVHLGLHELDQALKDQQLEELAVLSLVGKLALNDLLLGLLVDTLDV